jgi:hypothetical protein
MERENSENQKECFDDIEFFAKELSASINAHGKDLKLIKRAFKDIAKELPNAHNDAIASQIKDAFEEILSDLYANHTQQKDHMWFILTNIKQYLNEGKPKK